MLKARYKKEHSAGNLCFRCPLLEVVYWRTVSSRGCSLFSEAVSYNAIPDQRFLIANLLFPNDERISRVMSSHPPDAGWNSGIKEWEKYIFIHFS
jgi:hypothetical protein